MTVPQGNYYNVTGVDPNEGARIVFVWARTQDSGSKVLLGSGHVVGAVGCGRPPGVPIGQYCVTFPLPPGSAADDVVLTDDKNADVHLSDVTLTHCSTLAGLRSGATLTRHLAASADTIETSPKSSQDVLAPRAE